MDNLLNLIDQYLKYLGEEQKASEPTIRSYTHYLHRFGDFLKSHFPTLGNPQDINPNVIQQFKVYLANFNDKKGQNLDPNTQGYHLIALRSFWRYLLKKGFNIINLELISIPHGKAKPLKFLDDRQMAALLRLPDNTRDESIMELLVSTGLRVSDLVRLNRTDIDFGRKEISIQSKATQRRIAFLTEGAVYWLKKYLEERNDDIPALFIRTMGKKGGSRRLTVRSIEMIIEKYVKKAGLLIKVTPHTLRHTFAVNLLTSGDNFRIVKKMLEHKNISTTQIYTHVTNPQLKEIHQKFHRGNRVGGRAS